MRDRALALKGLRLFTLASFSTIRAIPRSTRNRFSSSSQQLLLDLSCEFENFIALLLLCQDHLIPTKQSKHTRSLLYPSRCIEKRLPKSKVEHQPPQHNSSSLRGSCNSLQLIEISSY